MCFRIGSKRQLIYKKKKNPLVTVAIVKRKREHEFVCVSERERE